MEKGRFFTFLAGMAVGAAALRYMQTENGQKFKHYMRERTSETIDTLEDSLLRQKEAKDEALREAERKAADATVNG